MATLQDLARERGFIPKQTAQEVQQPTAAADAPQEATAQEVQETKAAPAGAAEITKYLPLIEFSAAEIIKYLPVVEFTMDYFRNPEDALFKWDREGKLYPEWSKSHFESLISRVHAQHGDDIEQMRNPETRTEAQQRHILEAGAAELGTRMAHFFNSSYVQALRTLEPIKGNYPPYPEDVLSLKEHTVIYYFAKHREKDPRTPQALTAADLEEIKGIFARMDGYFMEQTNGGTKNEPERILFNFIEHDNQPGQQGERPAEAEGVRPLDPFLQAEIELSGEIAAALPLVQGITPTAHTMPNNALMNTLQQKPAINAGEFDMVVSNERGKRKEITAYTMVEFDPGETSVKITDARLSEYERQVSDAVISLWIEASKENLPPVFTPDMIFRAMPGGGKNASPQQKGAITKTIEKFRRLHITVDATEEMRKRGKIPKTGTFTIDNFYLLATHAEYKVRNGGQTVNAYKIEAEPIILTYCKMTNQLLTVPAQYIEIKEVHNGKLLNSSIAITEDRQAMIGYMLRRIAIMKHDRKNKTPTQSNIILFDTLFSVTRTDTANREIKRRNRDFCFQVLDYWKAAGFIKDFQKNTKGRSITGITIEF